MSHVYILAIFLSFNLNATNYRISDTELRGILKDVSESEGVGFALLDLCIQGFACDHRDAAKKAMSRIQSISNKNQKTYQAKIENLKKRDKFVKDLKQEERRRETIKKAQTLDPRVDSIPSDANPKFPDSISTFPSNNNGTFSTPSNNGQNNPSQIENTPEAVKKFLENSRKGIFEPQEEIFFEGLYDDPSLLRPVKPDLKEDIDKLLRQELLKISQKSENKDLTELINQYLNEEIALTELSKILKQKAQNEYESIKLKIKASSNFNLFRAVDVLYKGKRKGSGFLYDSNTVITSYHVIDKSLDGKNLSIRLLKDSDDLDKTIDVKLDKIYKEKDLASLKLKDPLSFYDLLDNEILKILKNFYEDKELKALDIVSNPENEVDSSVNYVSFEPDSSESSKVLKVTGHYILLEKNSIKRGNSGGAVWKDNELLCVLQAVYGNKALCIPAQFVENIENSDKDNVIYLQNKIGVFLKGLGLISEYGSLLAEKCKTEKAIYKATYKAAYKELEENRSYIQTLENFINDQDEKIKYPENYLFSKLKISKISVCLSEIKYLEKNSR